MKAIVFDLVCVGVLFLLLLLRRFALKHVRTFILKLEEKLPGTAAAFPVAPLDKIARPEGPVERYLWTCSYKNLGDRELIRLGDRARLSLMGTAFSGILFAIFVFIGGVVRK